jgi:hypothetical protein
MIERTGVSLVFDTMNISDSQTDSQRTVERLEEIEGIADQHLIGTMDGQHTDQPANEDVDGYKTLIDYLVNQLSSRKRKLPEQQ